MPRAINSKHLVIEMGFRNVAEKMFFTKIIPPPLPALSILNKLWFSIDTSESFIPVLSHVSVITMISGSTCEVNMFKWSFFCF